MKKILILTLGLGLMGTLTQAEDDAAGKAREARKSEMLKKYDKNGDGQLDETEKAAMREEMRKKREEERLKKYDKNGDGKLDDAEKEAMREDMKKKAEAFKKRAEENNKKTPPPAAPTAPAEPKK
jgi:Ca2+-binding EF-hand superfamily protein